MMSYVLPALTVLALAVAQSAIGSFLPGSFTVPLVLPMLLAGALVLPHRALWRLSLLGALATELGSGLPLGAAFSLTIAAPHGLCAILRRPRPDLPAALRGLAGGLAIAAVLGFSAFLAPQQEALPQRLLLPFVTSRLLLPAALAGMMTALSHALFTRPRGLRALAALGVPLP